MKDKCVRKCPLGAGSLFLVLMLLGTGAKAATVAAIGTNELVHTTEFIFHGVVLNRWTEIGERDNEIVTKVRFGVSDVIKGRDRKDIVLEFLGGRSGNRVLTVPGIWIPAVGEEGVFFVEQLIRRQVHPFLGWDQGLFVVRYGEGRQKRVFTSDFRPVSGLLPQSSEQQGMSTGVARGVLVSEGDASGMSVEDFKDRIRAILGGQR